VHEAVSECARPRAQQLVAFKPRNISHPPHLAAAGTAALDQLRNSTSEAGLSSGFEVNGTWQKQEKENVRAWRMHFQQPLIFQNSAFYPLANRL
jgi:hypothetical protein